jgi:hypothetical protein
MATETCGRLGCKNPADWHVNDGPGYDQYLCDDCYYASPVRIGWRRIKPIKATEKASGSKGASK